MEEQQQNVVRTVLRSEITWLVSFVLFIMGFVTTVIMPLQKVQLQLAQIQIDVLSNRDIYTQLETRVGRLELDHARMEQVINNLK